MGNYEFTDDLDKLHQTQQELEAELVKVDARIAELVSLSPVQHYATQLHAFMCKHNHTDACGWYYDKWDTPNKYSAKHEYKARAEKLIAEGITLEEVIKVVKLARGY